MPKICIQQLKIFRPDILEETAELTLVYKPQIEPKKTHYSLI